MRFRRVAGILGALLAVSSSLEAQQTQVNLLPYVNDALSTGSYCCESSLYPTSGLLTNLGVTFSMASTPVDMLDAWRGESAVNRTLNLPIGLAGVTRVYTLMDTRFGYQGDPNDPTTAQATLTFNFSGGSSTQYLYGCFNTRDHNPFGYSSGCWAWNDAAPTGSNAQQWGSWGASSPVVLDMQTWDLSAFSGQTLTSITIVDNGPGINSSFLRGVTVDTSTTVPEPATWAMLAAGLAMLMVVAPRRSRLK